MRIVCGLGNPGREYERHRHNVGFHVVDRLASRLRVDLTQTRFDARFGQADLGGERILLLQPQTFMNRSGRALAQAARFYRVAAEDILVVHDELDLPLGRVQLKAGGGAGGHNGLRSIIEELATDLFGRLRVGIGRPVGPGAKERVVGYVLSDFDAGEAPLLPEVLDRACEAVELWAREGMGPAMNRHNRR